MTTYAGHDVALEFDEETRLPRIVGSEGVRVPGGLLNHLGPAPTHLLPSAAPVDGAGRPSAPATTEPCHHAAFPSLIGRTESGDFICVGGSHINPIHDLEPTNRPWPAPK